MFPITKSFQGSFGKVFMVQNTEDNSQIHVCKIMAKLPKFDYVGEHIKTLRNEIQIHKTLWHPNIVQFVDAVEDKGLVYMFLEICINSDLSELVGCIQLDELRFILKQALQGE